jgi:hypothetical protein
MNNKYILIAVLALVPVAMKAGVDAGTQTDFGADDAVAYLEHVANKPEPSFFKKTGIQMAIGAAFALGGYLASVVIRNYLTPKTILDKEDTQATAAEQRVLRELETDIQRLMTALPQRQKELETTTNPEHIEYLKVVISKGEEQLQKKLAMHAALTQKFNED